MMEEAISIYSEIAAVAVPFAVAFEIGNLIVSTFLRAAFGGKLWFGSR